jgi:hypothetical protein
MAADILKILAFMKNQEDELLQLDKRNPVESHKTKKTTELAPLGFTFFFKYL